MPRNTNNHEIKLEQIYETSLKVFGMYGFKKTNIEDITEELGMTKGNIYFYVKNKKDLYQKTVIYALNILRMHQISALTKETNLGEAIVKAARAGFEIIAKNQDLGNFIQKNPDIFDFTEKDFFPENYKEYVALLNSARNLAEDTFKKGMARKIFRKFDAEFLTDLIFEVYNIFIIKDFLPEKKISRDKATQEIINFVLHGLMNHDQKE